MESQLHLTSGGQERPKLHIVFHDSDFEDEGSEEEGGVGQVCVRVCVCACMRVHVCVCVCVCVYVYIHSVHVCPCMHVYM